MGIESWKFGRTFKRIYCIAGFGWFGHICNYKMFASLPVIITTRTSRHSTLCSTCPIASHFMHTESKGTWAASLSRVFVSNRRPIVLPRFYSIFPFLAAALAWNRGQISRMTPSAKNIKSSIIINNATTCAQVKQKIKCVRFGKAESTSWVLRKQTGSNPPGCIRFYVCIFGQDCRDAQMASQVPLLEKNTMLIVLCLHCHAIFYELCDLREF